MADTNLPAQQRQDPVSSLLNQESVKKRFENMLGKKAAGFMSSVISATQGNKELKKADPMSIVAAAAVAASLDLPINPSLGFAHIVPYGGQAQFQMGWRGFVQLAMRSGQYKTINVCVVYEGELLKNDRFTGEMQFSEGSKESDKIIGYVAYFKLLNGFEKWLYMTVEQVQAHGKKYSKSFDNPKGKWKTDFEAMALKTPIKLLLSRFGILSTEMQTAVQSDQAVIKHDGSYSYVDGADDAIDVLEADPEEKPDLSAQVAEFDAATKDKPNMAGFVSVSAGHFKKTSEEIKAEAMKDLPSFLVAYEKWSKKNAPETAEKEERKECPKGGYVTKAFCGECKDHITDCPVWGE